MMDHDDEHSKREDRNKPEQESYGLEPDDVRERRESAEPQGSDRAGEGEPPGEGAGEVGPEMITGEPRWPVGRPIGETSGSSEAGGERVDQAASTPSATPREEEEIVVQPPLVLPWPGDPWGPRIVALLAFGGLVVAWLAGLHALTPEIIPDEFGNRDPVTWGRRFAGLVRLPLLVLFWTSCAYMAAFMLATLRERPIGDWLRLGERLLAATLLARLITFIDVASQGMERSIEVITQLVAFWLALLILLRVNWRDAAIILGMTGAVFIAIVGVSYVIQWTAV